MRFIKRYLSRQKTLKNTVIYKISCHNHGLGAIPGHTGYIPPVCKKPAMEEAGFRLLQDGSDPTAESSYLEGVKGLKP